MVGPDISTVNTIAQDQPARYDDSYVAPDVQYVTVADDAMKVNVMLNNVQLSLYDAMVSLCARLKTLEGEA